MKPRGASTVFHVTDIERALEFYRDGIGFDVDFSHGDPTSFCGLSWGNVFLHLTNRYPHGSDVGHGNMYIMLDEADTLYERLQSFGADILSPIDDRAHGLRDFVVTDPDGNRIAIGCRISGT